MAIQAKLVPDRKKADTHFWVDLVTHPEKNVSKYSNFENATQIPFEFAATGFSHTNAWWLAEASLLSYWLDDDKAKEIYLKQAGLQCVPISVRGTQCHLAFNGDFAIVAFRGTQPDQWDDILHDSEFLLSGWKRAGRVHQGFEESFEEICTPLRKAISDHAEGLPLWMTGHSLGAALAVLVADEMFDYPKEQVDVRGVYTFGCPRVGDSDFTTSFNQRFQGRSFRYVDDHDVVTHVAPELLGYLHVNDQRWINQNGDVTTNAATVQHYLMDIFGDSTFLYDTLQFLMAGLHRSIPDLLKDHAPVLYATHTWNDLFRRLSSPPPAAPVAQ